LRTKPLTQKETFVLLAARRTITRSDVRFAKTQQASPSQQHTLARRSAERDLGPSVSVYQNASLPPQHSHLHYNPEKPHLSGLCLNPHLTAVHHPFLSIHLQQLYLLTTVNAQGVTASLIIRLAYTIPYSTACFFFGISVSTG